MRRNPDLTIADIQARMMDTFDYQVKEGVIRARGPYGLTTLTNRTMRFRWESFNVTCEYFQLPSTRRSPSPPLVIRYSAVDV